MYKIRLAWPRLRDKMLCVIIIHPSVANCECGIQGVYFFPWLRLHRHWIWFMGKGIIRDQNGACVKWKYDFGIRKEVDRNYLLAERDNLRLCVFRRRITRPPARPEWSRIYVCCVHEQRVAFANCEKLCMGFAIGWILDLMLACVGELVVLILFIHFTWVLADLTDAYYTRSLWA